MENEAKNIISENRYAIFLLLLIALIVGGIYLFGIPEKISTKFTNNSLSSAEENTLQEYYDSNNFKDAHVLLEKNISKNPNNVDLLLRGANLYAQEASLTFREKELGDKAKELLQKVLTLDPYNKEAFYLLGYVNEIQQNYPAAHENYDKALAIDKNFVKAIDQKGHAYDLEGKIEEAKELYLKANSFDSAYPKTYSNLGRIYIMENELEKAEEAFNKVLELSKNNRSRAEAYFSLGSLKQEDKYNIDAEQFFVRAIETDPTLANAYAGLANEQFKNGDTENSFANLEKSLEINPYQSNTALALALQFATYGQKDAAIKVLEGLIKNIEFDITLNKNGKELMLFTTNALLDDLKNTKK